MRIIKIIVLIYVCFLSLQVSSAEKNVLFREEFKNLEKWKPLHFKKIKTHTTYSVESEKSKDDKELTYLKSQSNASASGLVYLDTFNVKSYPNITWRWKVDNILKTGNAKEKSGDDYALRIYVLFKYDPDNARFSEKIKYGTAKMLYGEYPPHSSLNYIWANQLFSEAIIPNPYTDKAQMILVEKGSKNIGTWNTHTVNILKDYQRAFKKEPPITASIAIMGDTDNTKESATAYVDYVEVFSN